MDSHADKNRRVLDSRPVSPSLFAHFVLRTANRDALRDWYRTVLNARLVFENDYISFITYDDEHHRVAFVQVPELKKPPADAWGLSHVAYTLADLGQLLSTYRRLKGQGIVPVRTINHGPTVSMYYKDPDGNQVELQVDAFDKAGAAGYFHTEPFARNPIGVLFDADKMLADYEAGVDESELLRRPEGPASRPLGGS
jgi:catechol 2,3-dioxygenase-like lactoylglutathione lyase family enzyme